MLNKEWKKRMRLYQDAQRFHRQADALIKKALGLSVFSKPLNIESLMATIRLPQEVKAKSAALREKALAVTQLADKQWALAVEKAGRKVRGWRNPDINKGSYECWLDDGQIFRP